MKILIPSIFLTFVMILNGCGGATNATNETLANEIPDISSSPDTDEMLTDDGSIEIETLSTPDDGYTIPTINEATKQAYLEAINVARGNIQNCGQRGDFAAASPLTWNDALYKASYEHSYDLANSNTFSHTGSNTQYDITAQQLSLPQGSSPGERMENNGYNWRTYGENIIAGRTTVQQAVDGWMASDGHCANIMNPNFREVGLALVSKSDSDYRHYWTQKLGTR